jgi:hypothetical protein
MGHERVGRLPRTVSWRRIVSALEALGSTPNADTIDLANRVLNKVGRHYDTLHRDAGVRAAFGFLVGVARSQRPTSTEPSSVTPTLAADATPVRLAIALDAWVEQRAQSLEFGELAKRAAAEALAAWYARESKQPDLFSMDPVSARRDAWSRLSTGAGFSEISRLFFARFTERFLLYFLEREASAALPNLDAREQFSQGLRQSLEDLSTHAFETSAITQSFAAGWFNKHRDHLVSDDALSRFLRLALGKVRESLNRGTVQ